jgi:hypothetical protein
VLPQEDRGPSGQSLTADEEDSLRRLGWYAPVGPGHFNWFVQHPYTWDPAKAAAAAGRIVETIRLYLKPSRPGDLELKAFPGSG